MNPTGVGVVIKNQKGEFLLHLRDGNTSRMPHQWCLVGGKIDEGEDVVSAAVRETKEETNFTLVNPEFVHVFKYEQWNIALVVGEVDSDKEKLIKGEGADFQFISQSEVEVFLNSLDYSNAYLDELKTFTAV
ncbi:MAG: NUDIX hydrolase [Patescibacteria group bacterium UBA2103]